MNNFSKIQTFFLLFALISLPHFSSAKERTSSFTPEQKNEIGKIALDYLFEHPEYMDQLEQRRQKSRSEQNESEKKSLLRKVLENKTALLSKLDSPQFGSEEAKVALIEFYDYQCAFCSKMAPIIEQTIQAYPQIRIILKDFPVFGERWPTSETAAAIGITLWQEKGTQAYLDYHYGLFKTGHTEGQLKVEDIAHVIKATGATVPTPKAMAKARLVLNKNSHLAKKLGLTALPTFIVMPLKDATTANITLLSGEVASEELRAAILKAEQ